MPLPMWSAASGDFGRKVLAAGLDEVIFVGRAPKPSYLLIRREGDRPSSPSKMPTTCLARPRMKI